MSNQNISRVSCELDLSRQQVEATIALLDDDATVPFIARYRKEVTGSLDEVAITAIRDRVIQLRELDKRREAILKSLIERDLLTDELKAEIEAADTMAALEDIYLPFRPKRRTRATIARERGLEPLAELLFAQDDVDPFAEAEAYVDSEKEVASVDEALAGARDIIAEWINEDTGARAEVRDLFLRRATITSKVTSGKEAEGAKFSDYFEWEEPLHSAPSHRVLAMRRGEAESILRLSVRPPEDEALSILNRIFVIAGNAASEQVNQAVEDSYRRLMGPAMETELRGLSKDRADEEAIRVFAENLRELLLSSPAGQKSMIAIDPGFRTGCKVVCLDRLGSLFQSDTIFPFGSDKRQDTAAATLSKLCEQHQIELIAVGNGTGGRETESFTRNLELPNDPPVVMVSEAGASVYSASEVAREEFPDHDITIRGAVSIGRRLMDPLSELVKIDPRSIGVGQYQHDVDQGLLRSSLDDTVMSCVNAVGVEVNTASPHLLSYVSGLGSHLARNIVAHRDSNGPFRTRDDLLKVKRLGPKAFEQAAGFLRIGDALNPLDRSAVHPESYPVVKRMAADLGCTVEYIMQDETLRSRVVLKNYITDQVGLPTLQDIIEELARPGRDPREAFEIFSFDPEITKIEDLLPGMMLPGIVTNVAAFGAFVDLGVHQDGLIHISQLADRFVKDPSEIVKVQQQVTVTVLEVDLDRKRISLSMRDQSKTSGH